MIKQRKYIYIFVICSCMLFSEEFKIKKTGEEEWFDLVLEEDVELFLDPYLIENSEVKEFKEIREKVKSFFQMVFEKIIDAKSKGTLKGNMNLLKNVLIFPEVSEIGLGYSKNTKGSGTGSRFAGEVYHAIIDYLFDLGLNKEDFTHIEILSFFSEGISHDRISDITANLLKEELIKYTQKICEAHKIPMEDLPIKHYKFDMQEMMWKDGYFKLPFNRFTKKAILLVPKRFLRRAPTFGYGGFARYLINNSAELLRRYYNVRLCRDLDKDKLRRLLKSRPQFIHNYVKSRYGEGKISVKSYDLDDDPNYVYYSHIIPDKILNRLPKLEYLFKKDDAGVHEFVMELCNHFKFLIEKQEGYKLLWKNKEEYGHFPEWVIQNLFNLIIYKQCEDNNIDISRESKASAGKIEFKFSQGYSLRVHLEVKLANNAKLLKGLQKQLPDYMESEKITKGVFMVLYFEKDERKKIEELRKVLTEVNKSGGFDIKVVEIDATKKISPSQL